MAVDCEINNEKMEVMLSQLKGKDITELLAADREKFGSAPCVGGGGVAVAAATPARGGAAPTHPAEWKKEEKAVEKEESDDLQSCGSSSMFPVGVLSQEYVKDVVTYCTIASYDALHESLDSAANLIKEKNNCYVYRMNSTTIQRLLFQSRNAVARRGGLQKSNAAVGNSQHSSGL